MAHDFTDLNSELLAEFGTASFLLSLMDGGELTFAAIPTTGDSAETQIPGTAAVLWAKRSDFAAEPRKGDIITVPAPGITGIQAGTYRINKTLPEDAGGGIVLGLVYQR